MSEADWLASRKTTQEAAAALLDDDAPARGGTGDRLADRLKEAYAARDLVRSTTDQNVILDACQSFLTHEIEAENLVKEEKPEYAADFQQASRPPSAAMNRAEILELMNKRIRVHSEIIAKIRAGVTTRRVGQASEDVIADAISDAVETAAVDEWLEQHRKRGLDLKYKLRSGQLYRGGWDPTAREDALISWIFELHHLVEVHLPGQIWRFQTQEDARILRHEAPPLSDAREAERGSVFQHNLDALTTLLTERRHGRDSTSHK